MDVLVRVVVVGPPDEEILFGGTDGVPRDHIPDLIVDLAKEIPRLGRRRAVLARGRDGKKSERRGDQRGRPSHGLAFFADPRSEVEGESHG
jgi:hypothetical protein